MLGRQDCVFWMKTVGDVCYSVHDLIMPYISGNLQQDKHENLFTMSKKKKKYIKKSTRSPLRNTHICDLQTSWNLTREFFLLCIVWGSLLVIYSVIYYNWYCDQRSKKSQLMFWNHSLNKDNRIWENIANALS